MFNILDFLVTPELRAWVLFCFLFFWSRQVSYNAAIDACARGGLWQRALDLLSEMSTTGPQPSVVSYNAALDACGREGRYAFL